MGFSKLKPVPGTNKVDEVIPQRSRRAFIDDLLRTEEKRRTAERL
jgi:hypothetical protein